MTGLALSERIRVIAVTDARRHRAHLMTDDAAVVGRHAGSYRAVCGELVLAASLTTSERGYCRVCTQWKTTQ